jgi:hypothetical protein
MRRLGPILIASVAILTAGVEAQAHDPPLFAAFKAFCIDTGASPDAVKSAVEEAGGKQRVPPSAMEESLWPMTMTIWDITTRGHSVFVSAGTLQVPPMGGRPEENSDHCAVSSFVNEDASIEAIRNWVAVPPDHISHGNHTFLYQELGSPIVGIVTDLRSRRTSGLDGARTSPCRSQRCGALCGNADRR